MKTNFFARRHQKTAEIFLKNTNISTTLTPSGPPGVSKEAKSFTELEFGSFEIFRVLFNFG